MTDRAYDRLFREGWNDAKRWVRQGRSTAYLRSRSKDLKSHDERHRGYHDGFFALLDLADGIGNASVEHGLKLGLTYGQSRIND